MTTLGKPSSALRTMTPEQAQEQLKVLDDNFALLLHERMLHASQALLATTEANTSSLEDRDEWLNTIAYVSRLMATLAHNEARIAILNQVEGVDEAQEEAAQ
jgi:hypothetical protein